jgi:hypothetical protein
MGMAFRTWRIIVTLLLLSIGGWALGADTLHLNAPVNDAEHMAVLRKTALSLSDYARKQGLDDKVFFLVDMHIPSGKNRFFVYDLSKDSVLMAGLVTQGKGNGPWRLDPQFSNNKGSACTSLGKYKIGGAYEGVFGKAYKLYGLDSSNSNAFARYVVLHAHESVPDKEVHPYPICQSEGCPTVSKTFLGKLDRFLQKRNRPVLLYIFN